MLCKRIVNVVLLSKPSANRLKGHYSLWEKRLHHLRHFYLQVAKAQQDQPDVIDLTFEPTDLIERVTQMPLGDVLTVDWQHQLRQQSDSLSMPVEFILFLFQMCIAKEPMHPSFEAISFCWTGTVECTKSQHAVSDWESCRWPVEIQTYFRDAS